MRTMLFVVLMVLSGCASKPSTTQPLAPASIQYVDRPVAACPDARKVVIPVKPKLAMEELSPNDRDNIQKVAKATLQQLADLEQYGDQSNAAARSLVELCDSVNTKITGP